MRNLNNAELLITGGTGSLGKTLVKAILKYHSFVKGIRVFSRDELKQWQMKQEIEEWWAKCDYTNIKDLSPLPIPVSYLIGDVRDYKRLKLAMTGATHVIHAAAMKQVPSCENHPLEAIKTNIGGAQNVLEAALSCKSVQKVIAISTDKAVYPINLYGVTKAAAEKLFIQGNVYSKGMLRKPKFSVCRYGNVIGSRGSVIPLFKKQYEEGSKITITHKAMTRFWITLPVAAKFIIKSLIKMDGGEIFIPKMPSCKIVDLAKMLFSDETKTPPFIEFTGIRPGEKIHECFLSYEESRRTQEYPCRFIVYPFLDQVRDPFTYISNMNNWQLKKEEFEIMMEDEI
jgi:UDP-N-acetylglucosamine 4,6-dehydratase